MSLRILYLGLLAAALAAAGLRAGEPAGDEGPAVTLRTREGSLLRGFLHAADLVFEKDDGSTERLAWKDVWVVELAERIDAKEAEAARAAVAELASENYQIRQKAQKRLEDLGRGAAPALRAGAKSKDPEVAIRARELLAKMGGAGSAASGDHVQAVGARHPDGSAKDVRDLEGTVAADRYELRTAHGTIVLPAESVDGLKVLNAKDAAALLAAAKLWPAPGEKKIVGLVPARQAVTAKRWSLEFPELENNVSIGRLLSHMGYTMISFEGAAEEKPQPEGKEKKDEDLEFRFADLGAWMTTPLFGRLVLEDGKVDGLSKGTCLGLVSSRDANDARMMAEDAKNGTLEQYHFRMVMPGRTTYGKDVVGMEPGYVHRFGCFVHDASAKPITLEAYSSSEGGPLGGRLLGRVTTTSEDPMENGTVFLGIETAESISHVLIRRPKGHEGAPVHVDDLVFSRVLPFNHDLRFGMIELENMERFVGKLKTVGEGKDRIAIRPAFLPKDAPSINVEVKDLFRIVPPLSDVEAGKEDDTPEPLDELPAPAPAVAPRTRPFIPHGILLQNGDRLLARLLKLDAESAVLELPGKVELKLPRAALRKIDLRLGTPLAPPPAADEGEGDAKAEGDAKGEGAAKGEGEKKAEDKAAPPADPLDPEYVKKEKTGVEFAQRTASAAGKTSTEGLPRMDNAEILSIDTRKNALTVDPKDGGPPWPIDLHSARFLVFPEAPAPAAGNAGGWELTLRIGSRFAFELQSLDANGVRGKLAGGEVAMPWSAIESLVRTPPAKK